jgi:hypothetical protein
MPIERLVAGTNVTIAQSGKIATISASGGPGSGEANTASNVGTGGVGVWKEKVGVDLRFKKIAAASAKVTVTDNAGASQVDLDVPDATTTAKGAVELATDGEANAGVVVQGNDSRLSNARTPTTHGDSIHDATVASLSGGIVPNAELATSGTPSSSTYLRGDRTWATPAGGSSVGGAGPVVLHHPHMAASAIATNLALNTFNAVSDPSFRQMMDLRGYTKVRIQGRIGGTLVAATKIRIQYHTGGNPAVLTGDAGWTTLADTAGSHTVNVMFYSAEIAVPAGAQVNDVQIRCGLFSGDGAADPTVTCCICNFYP